MTAFLASAWKTTRAANAAHKLEVSNLNDWYYPVESVSWLRNRVAYGSKELKFVCVQPLIKDNPNMRNSVKMRHVFIISDLHLGGRPDQLDESGQIAKTGFQICNSYAQLIDFIDWLATSAKHTEEESLELVINGDIVDFLAEDDFGLESKGSQVWTPDQRHVITKLDLIASRTRNNSDRGVFEALRDIFPRGSPRLFARCTNGE